MPRPALRSTSWIKKKLTTPGGKKVTHYLKRKNSAAKCAVCGKTLNAVPKMAPDKLKKLPKTKKRPERPYGGNLCHKCLKEKLMKENIEKGV
ncbi:MAG: 50S ribosomal protein L34e [Candidatus Micrarchaeota archaeon]|nr:50S ribosomal protein L34e [Candidatus Micrarchaeota archaeon]